MDDFDKCHTADHQVYLTNDYFLHGVPEVTSRRRQIRVSGIPKSEMWDLFVNDSIIDIGSNIFAYGQTYVALSRLKSLEGLYLTSFDYSKIRCNPLVKEFYGDS